MQGKSDLVYVVLRVTLPLKHTSYSSWGVWSGLPFPVQAKHALRLLRPLSSGLLIRELSFFAVGTKLQKIDLRMRSEKEENEKQKGGGARSSGERHEREGGGAIGEGNGEEG